MSKPWVLKSYLRNAKVTVYEFYVPDNDDNDGAICELENLKRELEESTSE
jgi:secreted trypsin-like serine protease